MLKSILSLSITAAFGLLVIAILLPTQADKIFQSVLGQVVTVNKAVGVDSPVKTISSAINTVINKGATVITSTAPKSVTVAKDTSPLSQENIIDATNVERVKAGLQPLKTSDKLAASAKIKAEDMIANHYFEHTSPSGKTVADLGSEVGYDYVVMGENLALGDFVNANDLLQAWMNSPGHRANILNTSYQDIGVYAAQGTYQGHTVWFAVQHFGTERGVCPALSTSLKTTIDTVNLRVKNEETEISSLRAQIEDPKHTQDQAYGNLITQFNTLVGKYNSDVALSQTNIAAYNKQVIAFNKCLNQYQASKE